MFDRTLLPSPAHFYQQEFSRLSRPSRGSAMAKCCFHDEKTPSLSLNLADGHFYCFGCTTSGGDLIDFVRLRDGVDFKTAAQRLGAWRDEKGTEQDRQNRERDAKERIRLRSVAEERALEVRSMLSATRSTLHNLDSLERSVSEQMQDASGEELEKLWESLSLIHDERREATAAYALLAFGSKDDRFRFVLNPESRQESIERVLIPVLLPDGALLPCGVRDDDGRFREIAIE